MNSSFANLNEEKKNKILFACLEEFAEKGYERASTNKMVEKAEISKGLLFHYFGSKKNLYLYLLDMAIEHFSEELYNLDTLNSSDFFERVLQSGIKKIKISGEAPLYYRLVLESFTDTPDDIKEDINLRYQKLYEESMPLLFDGIDYSLFRDNIDKNKAIEFIMLCFDSLYNKYEKLAKEKGMNLDFDEMDKMLDEFNVYMDMMKYGVYKKKD